jgi:hypothetical protein
VSLLPISIQVKRFCVATSRNFVDLLTATDLASLSWASRMLRFRTGCLTKRLGGCAIPGTVATDVTTDELIAELDAIQQSALRSPDRAFA